MRKTSKWTKLALLGAAGTLSLTIGLVPAAGQGAAKGKAGPVKRLPDGTPDIQGFWETRVFFTAFDVEEHKEATCEIPAGPGVVVDPPDGKIPYQAWALEHKKDLVANHMASDPQAHCPPHPETQVWSYGSVDYPGTAADVHAVRVPDSAAGRLRRVQLRGVPRLPYH